MTITDSKTPMNCTLDLYLILSGLSEEELTLFVGNNSKLCQDLVELLTPETGE